MRFLGIVVVALMLVTSCSTAEEREVRHPLLDPEITARSRPISTASATAQALFDQGLLWTSAFNHDEAKRLFEAGLAEDPGCAMAWWGLAHAYGPHINNTEVSPENGAKAWEAINRAIALIGQVRSVEEDLIRAMLTRYSADARAPRAPLDQAYASAMRAVWKNFPTDPDVGAFYAESLMDLHPWDLWTKDFEPKTDTLEIVSILEEVLRLDPDHPLANHLYIHAVEASATPEKASAAADRLRTLVPAAGHLLHMPAHIDLRLGAYGKAADANRVAMAADRKRSTRYPRAGFYRLYMAHNPHFLTFASMIQGKFRDSLEAARLLIAEMPSEFKNDMAMIADGFLPIELEVLLRFGKWNDVLAYPPFADSLPYSNAIRSYARGAALAALGRRAEARAELEMLRQRAAALDERFVGNNSARTVIAIPLLLLEGEILAQEGHFDTSIELLRRAATLEDDLRYDEPPDWRMPVRHTLGAVLLRAGRYSDAVPVHEADLRRFPENGWSLKGLAAAHRGAGQTVESQGVEARFVRAWEGADTAISSPCLCLPGK